MLSVNVRVPLSYYFLGTYQVPIVFIYLYGRQGRLKVLEAKRPFPKYLKMCANDYYKIQFNYLFSRKDHFIFTTTPNEKIVHTPLIVYRN